MFLNVSDEFNLPFLQLDKKFEKKDGYSFQDNKWI